MEIELFYVFQCGVIVICHIKIFNLIVVIGVGANQKSELSTDL